MKRGVLNNGEEISYALGLTITTNNNLTYISHGGAWHGVRVF